MSTAKKSVLMIIIPATPAILASHPYAYTEQYMYSDRQKGTSAHAPNVMHHSHSPIE